MVRFSQTLYDQITQRLGYEFKDKVLLRHALTHSSTNHSQDDYQRLEFLGDRVLALVIAEEGICGALGVRNHQEEISGLIAD